MHFIPASTCQYVKQQRSVLSTIKNFNFSEQTVSSTQGVTYAKGHTIIGYPKTPAGKRKMLILPGLLEALEPSQSEPNDPEAYIRNQSTQSRRDEKILQTMGG